MMIVDKASGIRCVCNVGSYHIFGETWYSRVYDVPGLPIRPGDVVFDVGANQGFTAVRLKIEQNQLVRVPE